MRRKKKNPIVVALVVAFVVVACAATYRLLFITTTPPISERPLPTIGEEGSTHAHASMLMLVNDRIIDFCKPTYMLRSPIVHFEDNNCFTIHKHATGVTVALFLETIGVTITSDCLLIEGVSYCREGERRVRVVYNGVEVAPEELAYREIRNNDHILINYGADDPLKLKFKYNQVPNVPPNINEPLGVP